MTSPKKVAASASPTPPSASPARKKIAVASSAPAVRKPPAGKKAAKNVGKKPPLTRPAAAPEAVVAAPAQGKAKDKLVRDSFTIPKSEYAVLELLKARAANLMRPAKKSEILRAGIAVLHGMEDAALLSAINAVPSLKTGRPKAHAA